MNREQAKEIWFLIKAFGEGVTIQRELQIGGYGKDYRWADLDDICSIHLINNPEEYRIKPEPEEIFVNKRFACLSGCYYSSEELAVKHSGHFETGEAFEYIAKRFVEMEADDE